MTIGPVTDPIANPLGPHEMGVGYLCKFGGRNYLPLPDAALTFLEKIAGKAMKFPDRDNIFIKKMFVWTFINLPLLVWLITAADASWWPLY
eukprot:gene6259-6078_t